jgi:anthranilate synthase / indole-3-glycerol phosphate synthase / phosphoribosylanthranilate isomerase
MRSIYTFSLIHFICSNSCGSRYQVLEARVHGADTLLLIVAILGVRQLTDLMDYSRSLGKHL